MSVLGEKLASAKAQPFGLFERMLAGRYLRAKRAHGGVALISAISVIAIGMAVAALIVTMSVMNGFRETLLSRILGVNGHIYVDMRGVPGDELQRILALARETPNVRSASPIINAQALASADGAAAGVIVRGVPRADLDALTQVSSTIRPGGSLDGFEGVDAPTILIGGRLAASLGVVEGMGVSVLSPQGAATPFGLTPRRKAFVVGGVFNVGMAEFDQGLIYMPLEQAQILFSRGEGVDEIEIRISDPDQTFPVMLALRDRLGPDYTIYDWQARSEGLADALNVERNVMRLILMSQVIIASLAVITGLLMLVKNKSRDMAILRTMGAPKASIQRIFFMTSAAIGVLGLLVGLALGISVAMFIEPLQNAISALLGFDIFPGSVYSLETLPAQVEWSEVAIVSVFTIAVVFMSTSIAAWWGSMFEPVEALRYE